MNKYWYILRNSYKENNKSLIIILLTLIRPVLTIYGLILFYSYLTTNLKVINNINVYFLYILVLSCVELPIFSENIRREIIDESYLNIQKIPMNTFVYYFLRSVGNNFLSFIILVAGGVVYLILINFSIWGVILFIPAVIIGFILSHLIYFTFTCFVFFSEQTNVWLFRIIVDFCSGKLFPLYIAPVVVQSLFRDILPFSYAFGTIALNFSNFNLKNLLITLGISLIWSAIFFYASNKLWQRGSYHYQENG